MTEAAFISSPLRIAFLVEISASRFPIDSRESSLDYSRFLIIAKSGGTILDLIIPGHGVTLNFISSVN